MFNISALRQHSSLTLVTPYTACRPYENTILRTRPSGALWQPKIEEAPPIPATDVTSDDNEGGSSTAAIDEAQRDLHAQIQAALECDTGHWYRESTVMLVGDGRAGKTALSNSMANKSFEETASTLGVENNLTCEVTDLVDFDGGGGSGGGGGDGSGPASGWALYERPNRAAEAFIAKKVAQGTSSEAEKNDNHGSMADLLQQEEAEEVASSAQNNFSFQLRKYYQNNSLNDKLKICYLSIPHDTPSHHITDHRLNKTFGK